jgi:hypothetical protein
LIPRKHSQQSNGAKPEPSAFCKKYISFANLKKIKKGDKHLKENITENREEMKDVFDL